MGQPHFIVFANEKGGTGKSTTAVHTAIALAASGHRVGGARPRRPPADDDPLSRKSRRDHAPARQATCRTRDYEVLEDHSEAGFNAAIERLAEEADVIVIDTPGRDDELARSAILAPTRWSRR